MYYVILILGGSEPTIFGPFTEAERDQRARVLHNEYSEVDAVLWLDIVPLSNAPLIGSYTTAFFEENANAEAH